ncbi:cytochrome c oxidase accessory protein CcoG [Pedobacter psychrodurus]|uniref:Cytochrome c oxidase accessory protein CcoG n=1 Tax=Pedobacter psychrodurus TaxID=2530456 RepID=A0A4R0PQ86_9SPHI|nr:cytochrome c oxidase accessory protein CcoG [Pedobacter psychrodurus]TCD23365.1 cytochrome c oxidase accessory protein CcoG [Pedobacter psychrodurus]
MLPKNKSENKGRGRNFIYPKKPSGKLYTYRKWVSYVLLLFLFSCPFLKLNDEQLVLLNFIERKFVFFGLIFTPQDFYLFALAMLIFIMFIVCFTVVLGRLWCGWACPQTIFMEMVFRRIEYWIEGDANKQKKLDEGAWNAEKIAKKGSKHFIFLVISFAIANTFLAYMISSDVLLKIITEPVSVHISGFISIWLFTLIFYGVFTYVREVVCTVICPYGRLQGVLLDNQSLVVAYDFTRGEPRGRIQKQEVALNAGDCVDCGLCVQVCPTGIDIREGTQLECVNCTACIDSCNEVMLKINKPKNLIGFFNQDFINERKPYKIGLKSYGYAAVLFVVLMVFSSLIYKREDIETTVLRASGTLYQSRGADRTSNLYNAELINKTNKTVKFTFRSKDKGDEINFIQKADVLPKEGSAHLTFFLIRKNKSIKKYKTDAIFEIVVNGEVLSTATTSFFAQPEGIE